MSENETDLHQAETARISDVEKQMLPKNTLYFLIGLVVFTIILLVVAVYNFNLVEKSTPSEESSVTVSSSQTKISIISPVTTVKNGTFSNLSSVNIDTGENRVTGVELHLTYDPAVLENVDINEGTFIDNPTVFLKRVDQKNGTIDFAIAITGSNITAKSGRGSVAILTYTTKKNVTGNTSFKFLPTTLVTANGYVQSVLKSKSVGSITLSNF